MVLYFKLNINLICKFDDHNLLLYQFLFQLLNIFPKEKDSKNKNIINMLGDLILYYCILQISQMKEHSHVFKSTTYHRFEY